MLIDHYIDDALRTKLVHPYQKKDWFRLWTTKKKKRFQISIIHMNFNLNFRIYNHIKWTRIKNFFPEFDSKIFLKFHQHSGSNFFCENDKDKKQNDIFFKNNQHIIYIYFE